MTNPLEITLAKLKEAPVPSDPEEAKALKTYIDDLEKSLKAESESAEAKAITDKAAAWDKLQTNEKLKAHLDGLPIAPEDFFPDHDDATRLLLAKDAKSFAQAISAPHIEMKTKEIKEEVQNQWGLSLAGPTTNDGEEQIKDAAAVLAEEQKELDTAWRTGDQTTVNRIMMDRASRPDPQVPTQPAAMAG